MRNLPLPSRGAVTADLKKGIRLYKHKKAVLGHELTDAELAQILQIYDQYDNGAAVAADLLKGEMLPASLRDEIYSAYDRTQEGRRLVSIRELCLKGVDLCPVCGIDKAVELDHHLPRSVFKPLAIYPRNLVPMCHTCNNDKHAGVGEEGAGYIHTYYDQLPDIDFLQADVTLDGGSLVVQFQIDPEADLLDDLRNRLTAQMTSLSLNSRWRDEIMNYLVSHVLTLHLMFGVTGGGGVRTFLARQANVEAKHFHRNHWQPALLRALAAHDGFVDGGFMAVLGTPEEELLELQARLGE